MTTSVPPDDYGYDEAIYDNELTRAFPQESYLDTFPNDSDGFPRTSKRGTYNIVSKDYGDHKVNYYVPREYGDEYGISQLEEMSLVEEQPLRNPSRVVQRQTYQPYDTFDYDNGYEYVEDVPVVTPHTIVNVAPGTYRDTQVITEIFEPPLPPTETIEYVYEVSPEPVVEEHTEYIIQEPAPQIIYVQEPQPIYIQQQPRPVRRTVVVQPPPPSPPPPPPPPPARPPRRKIFIPRTPTPERIISSRRTVIIPKSPSPDPTKTSRRTLRFNKSSLVPTGTTTRRRTEVMESYSSRTQRTPRSPSQPARSNRPPVFKSDDQPPTLEEIVAQNRAKRGGRIPIPKREVYEAGPYDPPTYHKNIIKNGFMVHK